MLNRIPLAMVAGLALASACQAQSEYECIVIDAFHLGASSQTSLWDISEAGVACGLTTTSQTVGGGTSVYLTDFYWTPAGGKTALAGASSVLGINNQGQIAGRNEVFDLTGGTSITVPHLPGLYGPPVIVSINDSGIAVGWMKECNCSNSSGMFQVPYVWDAANGARSIPVTGAKSANRVNNAGVIVGEIKAAAGVPEAFVYDLNTGSTTLLHPLFPPAPAFELTTRPTDISDEGVVVGEYTSPETGYNRRGFLWSSTGGLRFMPPPPAGTPVDIRPASINGAGTVVGQHGYLLAESRAFVWDEQRGMRDLNAISSSIPPGFTLRRAWRINDQGWIVGDGTGGGGVTRGFVLRPIVTPACYANCDGSSSAPVLNVNDFICFQNEFAAGGSYANCDGSTATPVLNVNDFVCFQTRYAAGCP
ncbi:MAG: hypothetical protein JNM80_13705 [Phycisphaerae bacterium]|nr:hypothetical protein [Phycisphaerae bacterium]